MSTPKADIERALLLARSTLTAISNGTVVDGDTLARSIGLINAARLQYFDSHGAPLSDTAHMQRRVMLWADKRFPHRTQKDVLLKLFEEVGEVLANPNDAGELADVLILVLDLFTIADVDPVQAVLAKMAINEKREWKINEVGIMKHVEVN